MQWPIGPPFFEAAVQHVNVMENIQNGGKI